MVARPLERDRGLADLLDLKLSTVTSIKNRLRDRGQIRNLRRPHLRHWGQEHLVLLYGSRFRGLSTDLRMRLLGPQLRRLGIFWGVSEGQQDLHVGAHSDYPTVDRLHHQIGSLLEGGSRNPYRLIVLPLEGAVTGRMFDYRLATAAALGVEIEAIEAPAADPAVQLRELSRTERIILRELVQQPGATDRATAEATEFTATTIGSARKKFEQGGLFTTGRYPDLAAIGYQLLVFTHGQFSNTPPGFEERALDRPQLPFVMHAVDHRNWVSIRVCTDLPDYHRSRTELLDHLDRIGTLDDDPRDLLFSVPGLEPVVDHDYSVLLDLMESA